MKKTQKLYIIHALWRAKRDWLMHNLYLIVLGTAEWLIALASTHRKQPQRELEQLCKSLSTLTSSNSLTNFLSLIFPSPTTTSGESLEFHEGKGSDWLSLQRTLSRTHEEGCARTGAYLGDLPGRWLMPCALLICTTQTQRGWRTRGASLL